MLNNCKVKVSYNSYMSDDEEIGALTCETFESVLDFMEHVTKVRELVPLQLKHDKHYTDVWEAKLYVYMNGSLIARENYRRHGNQIQVWVSGKIGSALI